MVQFRARVSLSFKYEVLMFTAVVRITGAGRLADFRERLRWLMVRDQDAEEYSEHHAEGVLEYRFTPKRGIPFPAFTEASAEFPELRVEAEWEHDGVRGRAVIENGRLVQQARGRRGRRRRRRGGRRGRSARARLVCRTGATAG